MLASQKNKTTMSACMPEPASQAAKERALHIAETRNHMDGSKYRI